ncbi:hypothetical protein [Haloarcula argentinensis]|uniref:Uncharacterized protein n=1 Tax=Haloarcula argentinensis TaxID=43776 RepID=A0ABU2F3A4_HALAR|nr:hypothetical protein [Haloarcula argentinensis]EMA20014.1 hypothetical protein C443_14297 [Haloarcula argentinensis DSM 12282]MDS0254708.1 hypothetical protein [Haloarcula argentinensis]
MKAGKISLVDSDTESLESFHKTYPTDKGSPFDEIAESLDVREEIPLPGDRTGYSGRAAVEQIESKEKLEITEDGSISVGETLEKQVAYTEFIFVPDSFLAVDSSAGEFLDPLLNRHTQHTSFPAKINLDSVLKNSGEPNVWKIGFEDRGEEAENGVVHGVNLLNDPEFGDLLGVSSKNQLGLELQINDDMANVFVAKSGYVEIYQPEHFDTKEYIQYVEEYILPSSEIQ